MDDGPELEVDGRPGAIGELRLLVRNEQAVHCALAPVLSPLVGRSGMTWFAAAVTETPYMLLSPAQATELLVRIAIPNELDPDDYRGALLLSGIRGELPVRVHVDTARASHSNRLLNSPLSVRLTDQSDVHPRYTRSLIAAYAARLGTLGQVTGGDAVGAYLAGIAAFGRQVARTGDGARLRRALLGSRAVDNGEALWSALHVEEWLSSMPPSPVLGQLRDDLAILLADDLMEILQTPSLPLSDAPTATVPQPQPVTFIDLLIGLWAWGRELIHAIEALAAPRLEPPGTADRSVEPSDPIDGPLLR